MAAIKDSAQIAQKWARVTPQRSEDFADGVQNTQKDWASETAKADKNWQAGVQEAISKNQFAKGVQKAGSDKWRRKTVEVGTSRWGQGVAASAQDYQEGFEPFRQVIQSTSLPPRFPKGDPRNLERVKVIAVALRKKKLEG